MLQNDNVGLRLAGLTILLVLSGAFVGSGMFQVLIGIFSEDSVESIALQRPMIFKLGLLFTHLFSFTIPAILALSLVLGTKWWQQIGLNRLVPWQDGVNFLLFGLACLPFVAFSIWLNLQIPLPDWAQQAEDSVSDTMGALLQMDNVLDLLMALLVAAVAAAVGEELLLRGIVQGQLFKNLSPHLAIWLAALLFSLMHLELAGLLPRWLLGVILGYTYYWSKSLWVPILLHFIFNGLQVVNVYITGEYKADTEMVEMPNLWLLTLSLPLAIYLFSKLSRKEADRERLTKLGH